MLYQQPIIISVVSLDLSTAAADSDIIHAGFRLVTFYIHIQTKQHHAMDFADDMTQYNIKIQIQKIFMGTFKLRFTFLIKIHLW